MSFPILTVGNTKLDKSVAYGYLTGGIHFAPANLSGHNVCPMASEGCKLACLNTAGRGVYQKVQASRIRKTREFFENRTAFLAQLIKDIAGLERKAIRENLKPAIRLNLTSDLPWESFKFEGKSVFEHFPQIQFYDYTKIPARVFAYLQGKLPANYHLTFSRSESNGAQAELIAKAGGNVAVVFNSKDFPPSFYGLHIVNGDMHDLRFLDVKPAVVGLYTKGKAKRDESGFVVNV